MQATQEFVVEPSVLDIQTPNLSDDESASLLEAINEIRAGRKQYLVLLTNRKVRKANGDYAYGPKRVAGEDYDALPGVSPNTHIGWMSKAPTNKRGEVYVYVYDEARAQAGENGHTNVTMTGIQSFKILAERPGPLAYQAEPESPRLEQSQASQGFAPQPFDPRTLMAQAMFLQAQAASLQAQASALMAQAMFASQQINASSSL